MARWCHLVISALWHFAILRFCDFAILVLCIFCIFFFFFAFGAAGGGGAPLPAGAVFNGGGGTLYRWRGAPAGVPVDVAS